MIVVFTLLDSLILTYFTLSFCERKCTIKRRAPGKKTPPQAYSSLRIEDLTSMIEGGDVHGEYLALWPVKCATLTL